MQFQNKQNISLGQNPSFNSSPGDDTKRYFAGEVKKVSTGSISSYRYPQDQKTDIQMEENLKKNFNSFQKRYYTSYSKLSEVKIVSIGMASPLRILQWAEKTLPNGRIYGEVLNANTLHHKTFKPQKGGLFCERIFGPLKDFECACGKIDKSVKPSGLGVKGLGENSTTKGQNPFLKNTRKFCPDCDVEYTWSVIRRYQLGYIKLNSPVLHVWFLKGTPSYLSILLDMKKRHLQNVAYCSETLTLENSLSQDYAQKSLSFDSPSKIFSSWQNLIKNPVGKNDKISMDTRKGALGYLPFDQTTQINEGQALSRKETLNEYRGLKRQKIQPVRQSKNLSRNTISLEGNVPESNVKVFPILERKFSFVSKVELNELLPHTDEVGQRMRETGFLDDSFGKNHSMFKFLNTLQYSIYHDSRALKNTESFKLYTSQSEGSSLGGRGYGLNSDSYNVSNTLKNSLMIWNKILKNLPMDLYILCSMERMYYKKILFLSIFQKWQKLYKQAYYKAMYKATKILKTSLADPEGLSCFVRTPAPLGQSLRGQGGSVTQEFNVTNPTLYTYNTSAHYLNRFIQTTKIYFKNYILLKLKTIVQPIDSFYLTTHLNCNSSQIINQLSEEMEKNWDLSFTSTLSAPEPHGEYALGRPTGNGQGSYKKERQMLLHQNAFLNKLSFYFLRPLLIVLYLEQKRKNSFSPPLRGGDPEGERARTSSGKGASQRLKKLTNGDSSLEGLEEKITDITSATMSGAKLQTVLYKTLVLYIQKIKNLNSQGLRVPVSSFSNSLQSLSNHASKKPEGVNRKFEEGFSQSPKGLYPAEGMSAEKGNVFIKHIPLEKTVLGDAHRLVSDNLKGNQIYDKNKNQQPALSNTIYTLSHRERWNAEKDWLYFLLYNTVSSEYTDLPISAYKSRLFPEGGALHKTSFSFLNFGKSNEAPSLYGSAGGLMSFGKNPPLGLNPAQGGQNPQGFVSSKMESVLSNAFFSGPGIVQQLLKEFSFSEIKKLDKQNRLLLYQLNIYLFKIKKQVEIFFYDKTYQKEFKELCKKRDLLIRRTKFVRKFFRKDSDPSSMILTVLPVLPPDLRPIVKMGNQIAASDLNRLYQRVIYRNERLKKFLKDPATSHSYEMKYAQRLLQEAVDNLIINGKSPNSEKDSRNRPLKSLSDILKGKQGRFRQFLLGKRVDYSGRSVIVVGPKLKLHECGIPLEMALELYLPFLLKIILNKNYAKTVIGAKSLIKKNPALAQELLREIMQVSPVLLNRAPTLHRLGFQAFVPKLVTGRAILLHPLVCSAFNADFDGDQMAVHVPITVEARAEAWKLMLARNNILSPATGDPLAIPSQDMVLGCYYLTTLPNKIKFPQIPVHNSNLPEQSPAGMTPPAFGQGTNITILYFKNVDDVMNAYNQQKILVHSYVWVKWTGFIENGNDQEEPIEIRISPHGQWQEISANYHRFYENNNRLINIYMVTTPGRILFNYILQNRTP